MVTLSFSNKTSSSNKEQKKKTVNIPVKKQKVKKPAELIDKTKKRVALKKYDAINFAPEYFTYINEAGEEHKFSGIIIKDENSYLGKQMIFHKVILTYHPEVKSVEYSPEYFTYIDNNGAIKTFKGEPKFDLENNTYFGEVVEDVLNDEIIKIYKEDIK